MIICATSRSQSPRPRHLQALAVFFVVLYVLSAVRGLVPGLCLNLTAPDVEPVAESPVACVQIDAGSCCTKIRTAADGDSDSKPRAPKRCPFCRLALGLTETPDFVFFAPLAPTCFRPTFVVPAEGARQRIDQTRAGRGPPQLVPV